MNASARIVGVCVLLVLCVPAAAAERFEPLVALARPGPWSGVSGLVGFGERLWLVNSVKFVNHNSADLYSYDPRSGDVRYERQLFSQDAGDPTVLDGRLFWPFEDARFSTGRGEYALTNGRDWRWRVLTEAEVFHLHAMTAAGDVLYAATSAWRAGLQRSRDHGRTWTVIHDHPTPPRRVSRFTSAELFRDTLHVGLTSRARPAVKLLRLEEGGLEPAPGWPRGRAARALQSYGGWLYAVHAGETGGGVWRTDGRRAERVAGLDGVGVRALAAGESTLWAAGVRDGDGVLLASRDGRRWSQRQRFEDAPALAVGVYAGRVYVGTEGPGERGALWGPRPPAPAETAIRMRPLGHQRRAVPAPKDLDEALAELDAALEGGPDFRTYRKRLHAALLPLALGRGPDAGTALSRRLVAVRHRDQRVSAFGGAYRVRLADANRWYLLWAVALNGHGRVPHELLARSWSTPENPARKYFEPVSAAAWAAGMLRQDDAGTLETLVARLGDPDQPRWVDGDLVGALTAITGRRFGHDLDAWRAWWRAR